MEKRHMLAAALGLVGMLMAFAIGCSLVGVPTAQQTPIITSAVGFLTLLLTQIWSKTDTDSKLKSIENKADDAASAAALAAAKAEAVRRGGP